MTRHTSNIGKPFPNRHRERDVSEQEITWVEKVMIEGKPISIGSGGGKVYACHHANPYFLFEEEDRLAAIDLASRALIWYRDRPRS